MHGYVTPLILLPKSFYFWKGRCLSPVVSVDKGDQTQGDIMKVGCLTTMIVCVLSLTVKQLAEVYFKLNPSNMIEQLILVKIEEEKKERVFLFYHY